MDSLEIAVHNLLMNSAKPLSFPIFQNEEFGIKFVKTFCVNSQNFPIIPPEVENNFVTQFNYLKSEKGAKISVETIIKGFLLSETSIFKAADLILLINDTEINLNENSAKNPDNIDLSSLCPHPKKLVPIIQITLPTTPINTTVSSCVDLSIIELLKETNTIYSQINPSKQKMKKKAMQLLNAFKIGDITFFTDSVLGYGESGAIVYNGYFQDRKAAVKCVPLSYHELAKNEITTLLAADNHPNIIRYYAKGFDRKYAYIAVELCQGNLLDFIDLWKLSETEAQNNKLYDIFKDCEFDTQMKLKMIKGIINGLEFLHRLDVVHKNIKPRNIMINSAGEPKLSDIGYYKIPGKVGNTPTNIKNYNYEDWMPPENYFSKEGDVFALGCLIYFLLTDGHHPFENKSSSKVSIRDNIKQNKYDLSLIKEFDTKYLIEHMIFNNPPKRYKAEMCKHYILFWSDEKILNFIALVSSTILSLGLKKEFEKIASNLGLLSHCPHPGWNKLLNYKLVQESLNSGAFYYYNSACDLVRFIRNNFVHYREIQPSLQLILGDIPNGFLQYFVSRFPILPTVIYKFSAQYLMKDYQVRAFLTTTS